MNMSNELDGVSLVYNRPYTCYLHHFVKKTKNNKLTVTCDMSHVTHYTCQVGGGEPALKISAP